MKKQTSTYKKMLITLGMVVLLTPAVLPIGFSSDFTKAYAEEQVAPARQSISIQKVMYSDEMPSIINDGAEQTLPSGATAFDPAKYGDVEFTLVDLTEYAKEKSASALQSEVDELDQDNYQSFITSSKSAGSTATTTAVNASGKLTFDNVAAATSNGSGHTYAIFETKSAKGLVNQIAKPIILVLPMTNIAGDGWFDTINVYPKNEVKELAFELVKYSEEIGDETKLAGAEFDIYSGKPGTGTKVNDTTLVTDAAGKIHVTGLTVGDYYFVETKAPGENVISGSALNDTNNKLTFTITGDGTEEADLKIDFINYLKPTSEKKVTNGTEPGTGKSSFEIGDAVQYENNLRIPTDIVGGEIISDGKIETTSPYHIFNYSDIPGIGLTYSGNAEDVKVVASDGTLLTLGTDYLYSAKGSGFNLDFIVTGGKVSDTVANYAGEALTISYDMTINEEAVIDDGIENNFDLSWSNHPNESGEGNKTTGKVAVYTGGAKFIKEDASTKEPLENAKFVILNDLGQYFDGWADANADGIKDARWSTDQPTSGAGIFTSDDAGKFEIAGLAYGNYSLKEIQAPNGYQLLTNTVEFTIEENGYTTGIMAIENSQRPSMPITGSTQLIITLVAGAVLVTVAGIYFKKRQEV